MNPIRFVLGLLLILLCGGSLAIWSMLTIAVSVIYIAGNAENKDIFFICMLNLPVLGMAWYGYTREEFIFTVRKLIFYDEDESNK